MPPGHLYYSRVYDLLILTASFSLIALHYYIGGHIVTEVCDIDNEELLTLVGLDHIETVVSHDIIGRLMIQCARESGLASVGSVVRMISFIV